jgi:uncharacterized protein YdcH (DUF465 family)
MKAKDMSVAQIAKEIEQLNRVISNAESNRQFWQDEMKRHLELGHDVLNGKTEVLWDWESEVK